MPFVNCSGIGAFDATIGHLFGVIIADRGNTQIPGSKRFVERLSRLDGFECVRVSMTQVGLVGPQSHESLYQDH